MNVIRLENRPTRGRGRGKGRDSLYWNSRSVKPITNSCLRPKYQSSTSDTPRASFNVPSSSSVRTPNNKRRIQGTPSSSSRIRSSNSTNVQPSSTTNTLDSTVVMAITSGRGDARSEVGMAAIDVKFPHLIISQISDTQTYANTLMKIHLFNPVEILMPDTMCGDEDPRKNLFNTIKSKFKDIEITPISRIHFNEENGLERVKTHCATEFSSIELFVKEKYYALATTAALLKYVEQIQHMVYEPKSMKIEFQAPEGSTMIDVESAINLELVSSQGPRKNYNLFSSLDRCVTPMGRRLLRTSILQPLCDKDSILEKQACVSELVRNRNLHTTLQPIIKQLFGADRLLGLSMRTTFTFKETIESAERSLNFVLLLKTCLEVIPQLASALETAVSPKFVKIRENLRDPRFQIMKEQILEIVHSDAKSVNGFTSANIQRCFALKNGINDMLDVSRQTYCELMEQTSILVDSLAQEYRLPLIVACNASLEYHIQMKVPKQPGFKISDLPNVFIEVQQKRTTLYMTTYLLMSLSQQCKEARNDVHHMSSCILEALIAHLRNQVTCLFQLSEDIAELDLVMSLARISGIPDYVKPNFGQKLQIIDSKHPIVDLLGTDFPRPNNIEASIAYNFCNITGPNMSGKSTYLKQVVLLQIMSQIGCYLPAKEATVRIANRIFCRLCPTYEDIESNASSFVHEIKELEYILQFITPSSLVVLDEICRSTNSEEGAPIAFAICESLLQSTAFIFNCTHFLFLTKLTELYHNAVNYYFVCEPNELDKWGLKYTYKLRKGITNVENYGISAATACRLPKPIIEKAKEFVTEIAPHFKPAPLSKAPKLSWQKDCYDCIANIMELIITDQYTPENVQKVIQPLRGNKNLKIFKENDLLCNVLQKNFQKQAPNFQNINDETQITSNVLYKSSQVSQVKSLELNLQGEGKFANVDSIKSLESNLEIDVRFSNNLMHLIDSNLNGFEYQRSLLQKSSNTLPSNKEIFQENASQQLEQNSTFKIPLVPVIKNQKLQKINQIDQELIRNSRINFEDFKTERPSSSLGKFQYVKDSFASPKNFTLYRFGFTQKKIDNENCLSNSQNYFKGDAEKDAKSNSLKQLMSASNLTPKKTTQDETSKNSKSRNANIFNASKNWLQGEIMSASSPLKRVHQSNEDFGTPSRKINQCSNNSRNLYQEKKEMPSDNLNQREIEFRNKKSEKSYRSNDDISRRSKSQSPSNFNPQNSFRKEVSSRCNSEKSWHSQSSKSNFNSSDTLMKRNIQSQKENYSNFSSFTNSQGCESRSNVSERNYHSPSYSPSKISFQRQVESDSSDFEKCRYDDNISRRSQSQIQSLSNFSPQSGKSPSSNIEKNWHSQSRRQNFSNSSPSDNSDRREIEFRNRKFEKHQPDEDNISIKSKSQIASFSNVSPQSLIRKQSPSSDFEKKYRSQSQRQISSNSSPSVNFDQREIEFRKRKFEKNHQSDDNISRRSKSEIQSLSNYSPQSLVQKEVSPRINIERNWCSQSKLKFSNSSPRKNFDQREMESRSRSKSQIASFSNVSPQSLFRKQSPSSDFEKNYCSQSQRQISSNSSPSVNFDQREIEFRKRKFEKNHQSDDNISRKSKSEVQNLSNFSPQSLIHKEISPRINIDRNWCSQSKFKFSNSSPCENFDQREIEIRNRKLEKNQSDDNISSRSKSQIVSLSNFSPQNSLRKQSPSSDLEKTYRLQSQKQIFSNSCLSDNFNQPEMEFRQRKFEKNQSNEDNVSRKSQIPSLSNFSPQNSPRKEEFSRCNSEKSWHSQSNLKFSNSSLFGSLNQRDIEFQNRIFEKNCHSTDDNISRKSQISLSNFSPQNSLRKQSPSIDLGNKNRSQSQKSHFANFNSLVDSMEKQEIQSQKGNFSNFSSFEISHQDEESDEEKRISKSQVPSPSNFSPLSSIYDDASRSYSSPSYSPLKISHPQKIDISPKNDEDNISRKSQCKPNSFSPMNWTLRELKNRQSQIENEDPSSLIISKNSQFITTKGSPFESKLNITQKSFQDEMKLNLANKKSNDHNFINYENPVPSFFENLVPREIESQKSPFKIDLKSNQRSTGLNLFEFSSETKSSKHPIFDIEYETFSKKPKYDTDPGKLKINPLDNSEDEDDSLSSFNTENLSLSLVSTQRKNSLSFQISSPNMKNSPIASESQQKSSQKLNDFLSGIFMDKNDNCLASNNEHDPHHHEKISKLESILDGDTIKFDRITVYSSPEQENDKSQVYSISSDDTIEAVNNIRRKEDEIFREIEENANDGEMFVKRMFDSPLSMQYSEELCSCSYSSSMKE